jgi:lysozyme
MPYRDSVGKLTIGVGRNIEDVGLSNSEVDFLLANDITNRYEALERLTWFRQLNEARQEAIVDMSFMGLTRLLGFQKMIAALTAGRYEDAAAELLKSKYAKQVGQRAIDLAHIIKTGSY